MTRYDIIDTTQLQKLSRVKEKQGSSRFTLFSKSKEEEGEEEEDDAIFLFDNVY